MASPVPSVETERKIHVRDLAPVRRRLAARGARRLHSRQQHDRYFTHSLLDSLSTDEALRIRKQAGERAVLAYKGRASGRGTKTRTEIELAIDDPKQVEALLQALGFRPLASIVKRRESWRMNDVTVCLDRVSGLGCFVELEVMDKGQRAVQRVAQAAAALGLHKHAVVQETYLELLLASQERLAASPCSRKAKEQPR